jgi:hypothetical protein
MAPPLLHSICCSSYPPHTLLCGGHLDSKFCIPFSDQDLPPTSRTPVGSLSGVLSHPLTFPPKKQSYTAALL